MNSALLAGFGLGLSLIVAIGAQNAFVLQTGIRGRGIGGVVAVCIASDVVLICAGVAGLGAAIATHPGLLAVVKWAGVIVLLAYGLRALRTTRRAPEAGLEPGLPASGDADTAAPRVDRSHRPGTGADATDRNRPTGIDPSPINTAGIHPSEAGTTGIHPSPINTTEIDPSGTDFGDATGASASGPAITATRRSIRTGLAGSAIPMALALTWLNPHVYLDTVLLLGSAATRFAADRWWFALGAAAASTCWFTALGYGARRLSGPLSRPSSWRAINAAIGVLILVLAVRLATMPLT